MNDDEFNEFWELLIDEANSTEHWWLDTWLANHLYEWTNSPIHDCGCRITYDKNIWSKTKNHVLMVETRCSGCDEVLKTKDNTNTIKARLENGSVLVSDVEILKKELGLE